MVDLYVITLRTISRYQRPVAVVEVWLVAVVRELGNGKRGIAQEGEKADRGGEGAKLAAARLQHAIRMSGSATHPQGTFEMYLFDLLQTYSGSQSSGKLRRSPMRVNEVIPGP